MKCDLVAVPAVRLTVGAVLVIKRRAIHERLAELAGTLLQLAILPGRSATTEVDGREEGLHHGDREDLQRALHRAVTGAILDEERHRAVLAGPLVGMPAQAPRDEDRVRILLHNKIVLQQLARAC